MNVCHIVPGLHPRAGGPSRTVVQLTDALAEQPDLVISLVTQGRYAQAQVESRNPKVSRYMGQTRLPVVNALGFPGLKKIGEALNLESFDVVHVHGIWHPVSHWGFRESRKRNIPVVLHPRGMLEPWALAWRSWKKSLAMWAYQRRDLDSAGVLFATAEQEAEGFRQFGLRHPIAVIPNGVEISVLNKNLHPVRSPGARGLRKVLFLSRIHPKKNLLNLLQAWAALDTSGWLLQLAGPDEGGHLAEVEMHITALGLKDRVLYIGSIDDDHKGAVYAEADLFVLPSFSENFGVVVAEALSYGLPVIATHGTPWQGLQRHGCGWWVAPTVDGLAVALRDATTKNVTQLREMGTRGQVYAREFDWSNIARETTEVYRWVLSKGGRPNCVHLD